MPKRTRPNWATDPGAEARAAHQPWAIVFFQRHRDDDRGRTVPGAAFLDSCPLGVRADLVAIVKAVADAPPMKFAGGGQWQAMRGDMAGIYEARTRGPRKRLYRLFCVLEREAPGLPGPSLVIVTGMDKANESAFSSADYRRVRRLRDEYLSRSPRSIEA
jgi:hypothetical protein